MPTNSRLQHYTKASFIDFENIKVKKSGYTERFLKQKIRELGYEKLNPFYSCTSCHAHGVLWSCYFLSYVSHIYMKTDAYTEHFL